MTLLLVGADRLGNMPKVLERYGVAEIIHWPGRKCRFGNIPCGVDMVLVIHDFVNHGLMERVKGQAKHRRLPIIFARRGVADLEQALSNLDRCGTETWVRT